MKKPTVLLILLAGATAVLPNGVNASEGAKKSAPGSAVSAPQAAPAAAPRSRADLDYDAAWAIWRTEPPAGIESPSKEFFKWSDRKYREFAEAVRAFGEKYPDDPRRYEGWVQASYTGPVFITGFKPEFEKQPNWANVISDDAAVLAFRSEQVKLLTRVVEADDATTRQRAGGFNALLIDASTVARLQGRTFEMTGPRPICRPAFDVTVFQALVDRVVAKFNDERVIPIVELYTHWLRQQSAAEADAFEAKVRANPSLTAAMDRVAAERQAAAEKEAADQRVRAKDIGRIKFTAADGREVDLARLRGKVVLVDFWATWCGPCKAEIPNVVATYEKYHDQGFEVVGISLENPGDRPNDSSEVKQAKLEKAKAAMLAFTTKANMPWPQYFDGKWWKNDYAVKFGIQAIPAMFLLDQGGRIVSTDARGEKLGEEVRRLLGISAG